MSFIIGFRLHQEWEDRMSKQAAIARIGGVELSRAISETERRQRRELSAAFRVAAYLGWNGDTLNHRLSTGLRGSPAFPDRQFPQGASRTHHAIPCLRLRPRGYRNIPLARGAA
jgi:hypothetical protein